MPSAPARDFARAHGFLVKTLALDGQILDRFVAGVQPAQQLRSSPVVDRLQGLSRRRQLVGLRVADKNRHRHDPPPTPAAPSAAGVGTGRGALGQRYIMSMSFIALISSSEVPMP